ncbi:MAG: hypothetical protein IT326_03225, partial [Anaerolineae bacterium]|nr:hypothetical protein [Anaerolineae bacterium]
MGQEEARAFVLSLGVRYTGTGFRVIPATGGYAMLGEDPTDDDLLDDAPEEVEAYCVHCRQVVEMERPTPIWTRRGAPGTRGECAVCGTTIFRMGRTEAHRGLRSPEIRTMVGEETTARRPRAGIPRLAAFINYAAIDAELARRVADDL